MDEILGKLFGAAVSILAGWFALTLLMPFFIYGGVREIAKEHLEIAGTPNRMVVVEDFQLRATDHWLIDGYVAGVLSNNSNNTLSTFRIAADYYSCLTDKNNQYDMQDLTGCNQVDAPVGGSESRFVINLTIPPHSNASFKVRHKVADYFIVSANNEKSGYFIKVVPRILDSW
jgi:hypothetical protein